MRVRDIVARVLDFALITLIDGLSFSKTGNVGDPEYSYLERTRTENELFLNRFQISDKIAINFERVRLDGGPLRVFNPWYDKTLGLEQGATNAVPPVPEEDEGCESEVSLESSKEYNNLALSRKVDRATSPRVLGHPNAVTLDREYCF